MERNFNESKNNKNSHSGKITPSDLGYPAELVDTFKDMVNGDIPMSVIYTNADEKGNITTRTEIIKD